MPPRGRKRRGKELVAAVATDAPGDAAVSPEYVEAVVAELEHESERRVKKLKRQMGDMRQEFLNHFQVELLKIPRKIREMKVEHFSSEYGGSMEEALKKAAQWEVEKVAPTPRRGLAVKVRRNSRCRPRRYAVTENYALPSDACVAATRAEEPAPRRRARTPPRARGPGQRLGDAWVGRGGDDRRRDAGEAPTRVPQADARTGTGSSPR